MATEVNMFVLSDAVDTAIEIMRGHLTTMEQRALIAYSVMYPYHEEVARLTDAILYGPDYPDAEIDAILKEAKDAKNDL